MSISSLDRCSRLTSPDNAAADPTSGVRSGDLLNPANGTKEQVMGIQFDHPPPVDSGDMIELDVIADVAEEVLPGAARPVLPGSEDVPATYMDDQGNPQPTKTSGDVALATALSDALDSWKPVFDYSSIAQTAARTQWKTQNLAAADIIAAWIANSGAVPTDKLGSRLTDFGSTANPPTKWIDEFATSGIPGPQLSVGGP